MTDSRIRTILLAIVGLLGLALFFIAARNSKLNRIFPANISRDQVVQMAEADLHNTSISRYDLRRKVEIDVDGDLLRFAQSGLDNDSLLELIPSYRWRIEWSGKTEGSERVGYTLLFDNHGKRLGFTKTLPKGELQSSLSEAEALSEAERFLLDSGIDTARIELTAKRTDRENDITEFIFTFAVKTPHFGEQGQLKENLTVNLKGSTITEFAREISLGEQGKPSKFENVSKIVVGVITMVSWVILIIILISAFFKKMRHDELEFKRGIRLAIFFFVVWMIGGFLQNLPFDGSALLAIGLAGLFESLAIIFIYPISESFCRDSSPDKLETVDLLFSGRWQFRELGASFLNSLFIIGVTLGLWGILIWLSSALPWGSIHLTEDHFRIFQGADSIIGTTLLNISPTFFTGFILLTFFPAFLQSKLKRKSTLIINLTIALNLCGLYTILIKPELFSFFIVLPAAVLWANFLIKYDVFTRLISFFGGFTVINFVALPFSEGGFLSTPAIILFLFLVIFFAAGVYFSFSPRSTRDFENYVPEYVSRIAERERLLKELEIARNIQMKFLPQSIPAIPKLEVASVCKPAMEIGGDYYDFVKVNETSLGVIIGDVSGKGVSAAFYMTMAKGIIKTLSKKIQMPKQLLIELNEIFYENAPPSVFVSVIYGYLDLQSRTLTFARAGHNPLIVHKKGLGQPKLLCPEGLAIGLERGEVFSNIIQEHRIAIEPGDLFVFFTDGVSESRNKNDQEFGEERLTKIIEQNAHLSAHDLLNKIVSEVERFTGSAPQFDDFTMVVVKIRG